MGVDQPSPSNLVVSQVMYHPPDCDAVETAAGFSDADDFEFIEIMNIGSRPVRLAGLRFRQGITFSFEKSPGRILEAGRRLVVVKNRAAFLQRYGAAAGAFVAGEYSGNLVNSGEVVELADDAAGVIRLFTYGDKLPWPVSADGGGASLVLNAPETAPDHSVASSWRASPTLRGMPGGVPAPLSLAVWAASRSLPADPAALAKDDPDGDGLVNLVEYALGRNPRVPDGAGVLPAPGLVEADGQRYLEVRIRQSAAAPQAVLAPEFSGDLATWASPPDGAEGGGGEESLSDGYRVWTVRDTVPVSAAGRRFFRMRVSASP